MEYWNTFIFYTWRDICTYEKLYEIKQAPFYRGFSYAWIAMIRAFFVLVYISPAASSKMATRALYAFIWVCFPLDHCRNYSTKNIVRVLSPFTASYNDFTSYPYKVSTRVKQACSRGYFGARICLFGIIPTPTANQAVFHIM